MVLLSPPKLLMILVIALIVLGPDKLPSAVRRVGAMWSEFKRWRVHLETEVRSAFPDLPSTTEIAQAVRSPITVLDRLADEHGSGAEAGAPATAAGPSAAEPVTTALTATVAPRVTPRAAAAPGAWAAADSDVSLLN